MLSTVDFSRKGQELISLYTKMAQEGYFDKQNGELKKKDKVYSDFELHRFRKVAKDIFSRNGIRSVLDYGCGGSDWDNQLIFDGVSAKAYFEVDSVKRYEPARDIDERGVVDLVSCFDVLEHIHISDIPLVVRELFSFSRRSLLVNVACYPASAMLPTGENAHITVRKPDFWVGVFSTIAIEFPEVEVNLFCSNSYKNAVAIPPFSGNLWIAADGFVT